MFGRRHRCPVSPTSARLPPERTTMPTQCRPLARSLMCRHTCGRAGRRTQPKYSAVVAQKVHRGGTGVSRPRNADAGRFGGVGDRPPRVELDLTADTSARCALAQFHVTLRCPGRCPLTEQSLDAVLVSTDEQSTAAACTSAPRQRRDQPDVYPCRPPANGYAALAGVNRSKYRPTLSRAATAVRSRGWASSHPRPCTTGKAAVDGISPDRSRRSPASGHRRADVAALTPRSPTASSTSSHHAIFAPRNACRNRCRLQIVSRSSVRPHLATLRIGGDHVLPEPCMTQTSRSNSRRSPAAEFCG